MNDVSTAGSDASEPQSQHLFPGRQVPSRLLSVAAEAIGTVLILGAPGVLALWTLRQMSSHSSSVSAPDVGGREVVESTIRLAIFESGTGFLLGISFMNVACLFGFLLMQFALVKRTRGDAVSGAARATPPARRSWLIATVVGIVCILAPTASTIVASKVVMRDAFLSDIVQRHTSMDVKSAVIGTASDASAQTMLIGSIATGIVGLIVCLHWSLLLGPRRPLPDSSGTA